MPNNKLHQRFEAHMWDGDFVRAERLLNFGVSLMSYRFRVLYVPHLKNYQTQLFDLFNSRLGPKYELRLTSPELFPVGLWVRSKYD